MGLRNRCAVFACQCVRHEMFEPTGRLSLDNAFHVVLGGAEVQPQSTVMA